MKRTSRLRAVLQRASLVGFALVLAEILLQVASVLFPSVDYATRPPWTIESHLPHQALGLQGNPFYFDHDANGFRNSSLPSRADVVALGDSHTYGVNVPSPAAWPHALADASGLTVYNMGLSGYGAAHGDYNLGAALELQPRWVVFGLYFGNDFYDDFEFAQRNGLLAQYVSEDGLRRIQVLEDHRTIADEVGFLFRAGRDEVDGDAATRSTSSGLRGLLSDRSRLYGLLRALKNARGGAGPVSPLLDADFEKARRSITDRERPFLSVLDLPRWRTILTSAYRFKTEDDADPRIRTGIEVSKRMILSMHARTRAAGASFVLLLIPTKEYVIWPDVGEPAEHPALAALAANEERIRAEIVAFAAGEGIEIVDPLSALRASPAQPYFVNADGHPNPDGHRIIAATVQNHLERATDARPED